ncbi:hypothetical protein B296_00020860 [Ensete ventricosum]|uniref:EDR1/CTR1/ARMC3-like peptidase-like domain-containing protein n=1 Tax=Ensete ventricosum TaxID=4639 RepID=A0A427AX07_ENSVE|nr:hypothetical protein B296_00020860 [Ensete ventricosum]
MAHRRPLLPRHPTYSSNDPPPSFDHESHPPPSSKQLVESSDRAPAAAWNPGNRFLSSRPRSGLDEERRPLLGPQGDGVMPTAEMFSDQDRVLIPLQRLSSGGGSSNFSGSLFTVDGNVLSGTTATMEGSGSLLAAVDGGRDLRDASGNRNWAQRARESYYLQSSLAARLTSQAFLAGQPLLLLESAQEISSVSSDSETVSYRLWVTYTDFVSVDMQELADYIGIPCRIAHGCKYCSSVHPSSCLVKVEDAKQSFR